MHMSIPPRFVISATKSKDLKSTVSREKLKEESEGLHPTTVAADRELKMMHGGEASASFQHSDDESDGEVDDSDSHQDVEEDFWNYVEQICKEDDCDILEVFKCYLELYQQSRTDALYMKITEDANKLEDSGMDIEESLGAAIENNKEAIKLKISNCGEKTPADELWIWCKLAKEPGDWNSFCKTLFDGKLTKREIITWFCLLFHLMDKDDLVQKVDKLVQKSKCRADCIDYAVEKYRKDILHEVSCGSGLKLNPWTG